MPLLALVWSCQWASAQTTFSGGAGGNIPDATTSGEDAGNPNAGIFTSDIVLADPGVITTFDSITLNNFSHSYLGDLVFELTHVDTGTTVLFLNRPYKLSATVGWGIGSALNGTYTFDNNLTSTYNGADSIWQAATNFSVVPGGTYAASANAFTGSPNTSYVPVNLNVFAGEAIAGTWELTVRDEATNDVGSFDSWQFNATVTNVPEPGVLTLGFLGALCLGVPLVFRKTAGSRQPGDARPQP